MPVKPYLGSLVGRNRLTANYYARGATISIGDLLSLAWRYRILVAVCMVATGAAVLFGSQPATSWNGRVTVVMLTPSGVKGNAIAPTTASVIATTGIVARSVNGAGDPPQTVSSDLTLTSMGVSHGWSVRQPNAGGQWDVHYEEPTLDVKSSGRTLDEANAQMDDALDHIQSALTDIQESQGVKEDQRIRMELSPAQPVYTIQTGSRKRAMIGIFLSGVLGTLGLLIAVHRVRTRSVLSQPGTPVSIAGQKAEET